MGKGTQSVKHVKKSTPEPEELKSYRTTSPTNAWEQFRNDSRASFESLRAILRRDQGDLCAYCEMHLNENNQQVAHFHPKSDTAGSRNWALEWGNLWLACKGGSQSWMSSEEHYLPPLPDNISCDERKGNRIVDGLVIAPDEIPLFPRIFRYEQHPDGMEMRPEESACEEIGLQPEKVQCTIDAFNLNCRRLAKARLRVHRRLEQAIMKLRESDYEDPEKGFRLLAQRHLSKDEDGCWPAFFTLLRWRFKTAAEDYLRSCDYKG
ncbi:MAG: retron system putative HNH endonuclease [Syntrophobacteraceae bacterium]